MSEGRRVGVAHHAHQNGHHARNKDESDMVGQVGMGREEDPV